MRAFYSLLVALLLSVSSLFAQIDVNRVMTIGQNALFFNDYLVSIGYFNQVIELRPWMADPYYLRALSKFLLEDYKGAEEDAALALERNAFIAKAYLVRGLAQRALKQNADAIVNLRKAADFLPDDMEIALSLAEAQLGEKQLDATAQTLERIMQKDKKNKVAYLLQGELSLLSGDTIAAVRSIHTSLSIDSTQAQGYSMLAHLSMQREEYPQVVALLDKALLYAPNEPSLLINRGLAKYHTNDYVGAIEDYSMVLETNANNLPARYNRALLRASVGDANNALADFDYILKRKPNDYMALYNHGLLCLEVGNYRAALKSFDKVLQRYPNFLLGLLARADAKRALGDWAGADRDLWQAEQQQRGRVPKKKRPSASKETRREEDEAIDAYDQLIETAPSSLPETAVHLPHSLRGKIQNRDVAIEPLDCFVLSYFPPSAQSGLTPRLYYSAVVDDFNAHASLPKRVSIVPPGQIIDTMDIAFLRQELQHIGGQTSKGATDCFRWGMAALLLQDVEQAEQAFSQAIERDPRQVLFYFARAVARKRSAELNLATPMPRRESLPTERTQTVMGVSTPLSAGEPMPPTFNYERVLTDWDKALQLAPDFHYLYYNRAVVREKMGQKALALEDYNRALEHLSHPEIYFNRGLLLLSLGRKEEAVKDLSKAGEGGIYQAYNIIKKIRQ